MKVYFVHIKISSARYGLLLKIKTIVIIFKRVKRQQPGSALLLKQKSLLLLFKL